MSMSLLRVARFAVALLLWGTSPPLSAQGAARTATPSAGRVAPRDSVLMARADLGRIKGSPTAKVWVVVISDFQCPYCQNWHQTTGRQVEAAYVRTGKIRLAYVNFPVAGHRNAEPAHEVAMCAAEQGKFWEVADALFATQDQWKGLADPAEYLDDLAARLDVDMPRQRACLADGSTRPLIAADRDRSVRVGVGATPSFYIGSRLLVGAQPFEAFKAAIDAALAAAAAQTPAR